MTIEEFGRRLRQHEMTAVQITEQCLARIEAHNARLNAFILVMRDEAIQQARVADAELASGRDRGALHGVPVSVKDLFDILGTPTTAASRVRAQHIAKSDAPAIGRLREAGAVLIGKTNLHEFAFGTTNEDSAYGPARNPYDETRSPGGSSGGSAVSVATGMALATVGSDTGGSIRIPAAACGIVGLKPTYGEVPLDGVVPLSPTLDHGGPLTRTVTDAWHMLQALRGDQVRRPLAALAIAGQRIAVPRPYFCDLMDDDVRASFEASLEALRGGGALVEDTKIPHGELSGAIYLPIVFGDAAAYHAETLDRSPELYTPPVRLRLELARYVLAEDYVRALAGRDVLTREVDAALDRCDALAMPTLPIPAPPLGAASVQVGSATEPVRNVMLRLTQTFDLTGHPAVSLPCGRTAEGLPCGFQLVGRRGQTEELLKLAQACERLLP